MTCGDALCPPSTCDDCDDFRHDLDEIGDGLEQAWVDGKLILGGTAAGLPPPPPSPSNADIRRAKNREYGARYRMRRRLRLSSRSA